MKLSEKFQVLADELTAFCRSFGESKTDRTRWLLSDPPIGKSDVAGRHAEFFDRSDLESEYVLAIGGSRGSKQDMAMAKVQSDFVSAVERDFMQRHRSRIRRLSHETAARSFNGSDLGVIQSGVLFYVQRQSQRVVR